MEIRDSLEVKGKVTMPRAIVNGIQILPVSSFVDGADHSWSISPEGEVTLTLNIPTPEPDTYTNAAASTVTVGGIPAGTTFEAKTMTEMWTQLLYQELFPSLTNPSSTFTLTPSGLQEIGDTLSLGFSATFNRGSITPAYGTSGFRSGLPNQYNYTGTGLSVTPSTSLSDSVSVIGYVVAAGVQSWACSVDYDAGEQPLSNFGNNYQTPLPAGTTGQTSRTITGVLPTFATTTNITTLTKQSLVTNGGTLTLSMVAESGSDKQTVQIPELWGNPTILEQYNTLSGAWDPLSLATFTVTSTSLTVNSISQPYRQFTHNGATIGARQIRWRL